MTERSSTPRGDERLFDLKPDAKGFAYVLMWMDHLLKHDQDADPSYVLEWRGFVDACRTAILSDEMQRVALDDGLVAFLRDRCSLSGERFATPPAMIRAALLVLLGHIEPGWDNCKWVVQEWIEGRLDENADGKFQNAADSRTEDCPSCKGSGETQVYDTTRGPDGESYDVACVECGGTGVRASPSTWTKGK